MEILKFMYHNRILLGFFLNGGNQFVPREKYISKHFYYLKLQKQTIDNFLGM